MTGLLAEKYAGLMSSKHGNGKENFSNRDAGNVHTDRELAYGQEYRLRGRGGTDGKENPAENYCQFSF